MDPQHAQTPTRALVTTILMTDLVDSTRLVEKLGDRAASDVFARLDDAARELLVQHNGREIDKTDGFLMLFDRPVDAVLYALAFHDRLAALSGELAVTLEARAAIHLGEVFLRENTPEHVQRGAKPLEVEGLAKPMAARVMNLAMGGQTLLTQGSFDLARRAIVGADVPDGTAWVAHGPYLLKGCEDPVEIFEIGVEGRAPLAVPPDTPNARRSVAAGDEEMLGWRPAVSLPVPNRRGWILDRKLGEGGFGEVWLAINKRTGTKRVFKFCFDSDRLRSFKRELTLFRLLRDALGDREDIAKLHEVQLEESPYYLETSFTEGGSLLDWAGELGGIETVPLETRIDLVARTASAVAAAHSVGVLHKDIKPGNILIYQEHGEPRPRLADFGIGLLTDRAQLEGRNITFAGFTRAVTEMDSLTGTPMYTPPEALVGRPATVRGDVFALGVLLYQMVVGDLERPLGEGWERDIEDPLLREDIAACVQGTESDRLADADVLAERLRSIERRRVSLRWRRRRRAATIAAAVLLVLFGIGTVLGVREIAQRRAVERQRDTAQAVAAFLSEIIGEASAEKSQLGADLTMRDLLKRYEPAMEERFADQPHVKVTLLTVLARTRKQLSDLENALANSTQAIELIRANPDHPEIDAARTFNEHGAILWYLTRYSEAEVAYLEALTLRQTTARQRPDDPDAAVALAETLKHLAATRWQLGRVEEATAGYEDALEIYSRVLGPEDVEIAKVYNNMGHFATRDGDLARADELLRESIRVYEISQEAPGYYAMAKHNLALRYLNEPLVTPAIISRAEPLLRDAVRLKRESMGEDNYHVAFSQFVLGELLIADGRAAEADAMIREAIDNLTTNKRPQLPALLTNIAHARLVAGDADGARRDIEMVRSLQRDTDRPSVIRAERLHAEILLTQGDPGAGPIATQAFERAARFASERPTDPGAQLTLASCAAVASAANPTDRATFEAAASRAAATLETLERLGRIERVMPVSSQGLAMLGQVLDAAEADRRLQAIAHQRLGGALEQADDASAESAMGNAVRLAEAAFGPTHERLAFAHLSLGCWLVEHARPDEAEAHLVAAAETLLRTDHPNAGHAVHQRDECRRLIASNR